MSARERISFDHHVPSEATVLLKNLRPSILDWLESHLTAGRRAHSVRVGQMARELGERFGVDPDRCEIAGLLHDVAREWSPERLATHAQMLGLEWGYLEQMAPMPCLHGPVGAALAGDCFDLRGEPDVLSAIARHTVGAEAMTPLEQIVFLADAMEPGRGEAPYLRELRAAAEKSLAYACRRAYDHTFEYLLKTEQPIHPDAVKGRNWLLYQERSQRTSSDGTSQNECGET
ncbi:MAG: bis(5'-nucleosyl)-tetraphosphatase (symmetrical) YqeK [Candidatus Sericytochromatia bacterium]|nr:bis(5'-nucleosyl)-tetraphosphatase (symmetrical) YqeK [Candidatus Sericytochromatia bacterium]